MHSTIIKEFRFADMFNDVGLSICRTHVDSFQKDVRRFLQQQTSISASRVAAVEQANATQHSSRPILKVISCFRVTTFQITRVLSISISANVPRCSLY